MPNLPTALVAGAGGFIGSPLCDALIYQNCLVYGLDNWSTGKKENLKQLLNNKNFVFLEHDLNLPLKISLPSIDYIFHLAGIEAYLNGLDVSLETLLVNSQVTRQLLDLAKKDKAKFLLGSTIDVYFGFLSATDLNQYFSPDRKRQEAYSHHEAKRFSEALVHEYYSRYGLDARVVRLGHLYGPRQNLDSGDDIARLFKAAIAGKPLVVAGQGIKSLYPTYVSDLIYGLTKAMFSQSSTGQIYTLVNPQKTSALNFANLLKKIIRAEDLAIEFSSEPTDLDQLALSGVASLKQAREVTDFTKAERLVRLTDRAADRFSLSRRLLRQASLTTKILGLRSISDNYDRLLSIGINLSQGGKHLALAGESGALLSQIVLHNEDGNITEALKRVQLNLDQAYSELSFVESELQSGRELTQDLTSPLVQEYQTLTDQLPKMRQKINQLRNILPLVPAFIAQNTKKTYLVLFQNSTELRPTGGFIGSYGLLTFEKGKLLDFSVEDIYAADGQLKGFVEPPEPIKEFLGQSTWFFRDSNWDPDFTVSAERAEWFLQKTTNRNVDGTIAVNLPAVKFLLEAIGPLTLSDYNEEVSAENLFDRAEYRAEIDFFPGSTQKKDFLGSLAREIFTKAQNGSASDLIKLAQASEAALAQKQILIYLHDADSQKQLI